MKSNENCKLIKQIKLSFIVAAILLIAYGFIREYLFLACFGSALALFHYSKDCTSYYKLFMYALFILALVLFVYDTYLKVGWPYVNVIATEI